jgi:hypothetical protein
MNEISKVLTIGISRKNPMIDVLRNKTGQVMMNYFALLRKTTIP